MVAELPVDRLKAGKRLRVGDVVCVPHALEHRRDAQSMESDAVLSTWKEKDIKSKILYMDDDIVALNKPPGLASQVGILTAFEVALGKLYYQGGAKGTEHIGQWLPLLKFDQVELPRIVHRLDKVMVQGTGL